MANDKNATVITEVERISLQEEREIQLWSNKFQISPDELKRAVIDVGFNVKVVEAFINKAHHK